jgi:hypothetical protein
MKTLFILILTIICISTTQSQVYREWVQRYGRAGNLPDNPNRVGIDRSGNIICVNNPNPGNNADIDLLKYNPSGTNLWIQPFNGVQNENDYPEMLYIDDSSKIYYGGPRNQAFGGQACDPYIRKYNSDGTLQWDILFNSTSEYGHISNMFTDLSGNITFVGYWGSSTPNIDVHLRKLTPGGSQTWTNQWVVPGQREDGNCIVRDASGNIYTAGGYNLSTATDIFVKKYDSFGTTLWTAIFNGPQNKADYVYSGGLAVDNNGNVYALGIANDNDIWNNGGDIDIVLLKYNSSGVQQWVRYIKGNANAEDWPSGIAIDPQNNIYISGSVKETAIISYAVLAKYNVNGDSVWVKRYNGTSNMGAGFSAPILDKFGNIYIGGYHSVPSSDGLVRKYNSAGSLIWSQSYNGTSPDSSDYFGTPAIDSNGTVYCIGGSWYTGTGTDMILVKYLQPPYDPTNLTATGVSNSKINLAWLDNASIESGYKIERSTNAGANWILKDSVLGNVTTYSDTGLTANTIYHYRIFAYNLAGASGYSNVAFDTTLNLTGLNHNTNDIPKVFKLYNNYPNPFNPSTLIKFDLPAAGKYSSNVKLIVYDLLGREVSTLVNEQLQPGSYEVTFDAGNLGSGIYFYKLVVIDASTSLSTSFTDVKKMVLIK